VGIGLPPRGARRLEGRKAIVTGASRGIGFAIAEGLLVEGATVVLSARGEEGLDAARKDLAARFGDASVRTRQMDVASASSVTDGVGWILDELGGADILVNNAGRQLRRPLLELEPREWDDVLRTNVSGMFLVARAVARAMLADSGGAIVNIASIQADLARPSIGAYTTSKGAVRNLTRAMAAEWADGGVRVNAVAPGYIRTEMTRPLADDPDFDGWVRRRTPAGRWGEVHDIVGPVVWLCTDDAAFVHGQTIFVDGGMSVVV
jgi:gluconate 5-dehydrogenase